MGKFRQCLTELSAHDKIMAGYVSLTVLLLPAMLLWSQDKHRLGVIFLHSFIECWISATAVLCDLFVHPSEYSKSRLRKQ